LANELAGEARDEIQQEKGVYVIEKAHDAIVYTKEKVHDAIDYTKEKSL